MAEQTNQMFEDQNNRYISALSDKVSQLKGLILGIGAEVAARVTEECFYSLESPVLRVGGFDTPYPASRIEEDFLPDLDRVLDAVDRTLAY